MKNSQGNTVLKLEGRLADRWVEELAAVVAAQSGGTSTVIVDLDGLSFVDQAGVALLRGLAGRGIVLSGGSVFVNALLA